MLNEKICVLYSTLGQSKTGKYPNDKVLNRITNTSCK